MTIANKVNRAHAHHCQGLYPRNCMLVSAQRIGYSAESGTQKCSSDGELADKENTGCPEGDSGHLHNHPIFHYTEQHDIL